MRHLHSKLLPALLTFLALGAATQAEAKYESKERIWVYLQLNIEEGDDVSAIWLYGQLNHAVYEAIQEGETEGFAVFHNVRYMDTSTNKIMPYADEQFGSIITFQRRFVALMYELKGDPLETYPPDQVHLPQEELNR